MESGRANSALAGVPGPVRRVVEALREAGHPSFLVGGCVRDLLRGELPGDFDVATPAAPQEVLDLFPRAVAVGVRHGTVMIPTAAGPIDVTSFRSGPRLEDDLAHRDFTINALAADLASGELLDPFGGRADLARGRLRAVLSAADRFAEDPLRALRAARLAACLELEVDPEVERAMAASVPALRTVARERIRRELELLLLAPAAGAGLALLRRTGIEADLVPGARPDAAAVVPALPADRELRMAAWLRGARAPVVLRQLRYPRRAAQQVERLLRCHPVERGVSPERNAAVRRHLKRIGVENAASLLALRRAELEVGDAARRPDAADARKRVDALATAFTRVQRAGKLALQRHELAIDGAEVMRVLGLPAGPAVGRALRHLTDCVIEDPGCNEPDALRARLLAWRDAERRGGEPGA
jgi:tRNA nucleotidyltransferase (CCA-adding enzyme)